MGWAEWMGGLMDGIDPGVVRAQEVQERVVGVVAEHAKKWQLPCKVVWRRLMLDA